MQVTRAAFQAVASLNEQATDPKSHTLVRITYTLSSPVLPPAIPMVDPVTLVTRNLQQLTGLIADDTWGADGDGALCRSECSTARRLGGGAGQGLELFK